MHKSKLSERLTVRLTLREASDVAAAARDAAITPSELTRRALAKLLDSRPQQWADARDGSEGQNRKKEGKAGAWD